MIGQLVGFLAAEGGDGIFSGYYIKQSARSPLAEAGGAVERYFA
jgi:hypothetical protein